MSFHRNTIGALAAAALAVGTATLDAQTPAFVVDGDKVTVRGCVKRPDAQVPLTPADMLIWSRSDIMLAGVAAAQAGTTGVAAVQPTGVSGRVFYWLDDDEDLTRHIGQRVEVKGDLKDFQVGEIKVERDGDFTKIELSLDGKKEQARVPTSWLRGSAAEEQEFKIVARRVGVDDVRVLGACEARSR